MQASSSEEGKAASPAEARAGPHAPPLTTAPLLVGT